MAALASIVQTGGRQGGPERGSIIEGTVHTCLLQAIFVDMGGDEANVEWGCGFYLSTERRNSNKM